MQHVPYGPPYNINDDASDVMEISKAPKRKQNVAKGVKEISSAMLGAAAGMSQSIQMLTNSLVQQPFPPYQMPPYPL